MGVANDREAERLDLALRSPGDADQTQIDANGLRRQCGKASFASKGQHGPSAHIFPFSHQAISFGMVRGEINVAHPPG